MSQWRRISLETRLDRRSLVGLAVLASLVAGPAYAQTAGAADPASARAMIHAAAAGDADAVARFLGIGVPVDARDEKGRTALLAAVQGNHIEVARILIQSGADVNAKDSIQDSPYLLAGARGHLEILEMTLAHGADLKSTNRYGGTALIPACHYGHVEVVYRLLKTSIDVNHVNRLGWTALLEAVILGDGGPAYIEIVDALLAAGADRNIADREGVRPLDHARRRGFTAIAARLAR
jgi:ankyrin repeat protein